MDLIPYTLHHFHDEVSEPVRNAAERALAVVATEGLTVQDAVRALDLAHGTAARVRSQVHEAAEKATPFSISAKKPEGW